MAEPAGSAPTRPLWDRKQATKNPLHPVKVILGTPVADSHIAGCTLNLDIGASLIYYLTAEFGRSGRSALNGAIFLDAVGPVNLRYRERGVRSSIIAFACPADGRLSGATAEALGPNLPDEL